MLNYFDMETIAKLKCNALNDKLLDVTTKSKISLSYSVSFEWILKRQQRNSAHGNEIDSIFKSTDKSNCSIECKNIFVHSICIV